LEQKDQQLLVFLFVGSAKARSQLKGAWLERILGRVELMCLQPDERGGFRGRRLNFFGAKCAPESAFE